MVILPPFSTKAVAQSLEFLGYGPASAINSKRLVVSPSDRPYHLTLQADGVVCGFPDLWSYQNPLHSTVKAVLNVVSNVFVGMSDYPFLEDTVDDEQGNLLMRSTFLWMLHPEAAPQHRKRMILNELIIGGDAVWCQLDTMPYQSHHYANFFTDIRRLLLDFQANGHYPVNMSTFDLNEAIMNCTPDAEDE